MDVTRQCRNEIKRDTAVTMLTRTRALHDIEAILVESFRSFAGLPGGMAIDGDGVAGVITDVPMPFFNGIGETRFASDVDERVERTIDIYRARSRSFRWWVPPSTEPRDLVATLRAHGLRHVWDSAGMAADLTNLTLRQPQGQAFTIRRVTDRPALTQWGDILGEVFAMLPADAAIWVDAYHHLGFGSRSGWTQFVAYLDGQPVATSSLLLRGALAGIYHVGTLEEARGRGIGAAITLEAMRLAREAGATTAVLQSSEMGAGVYRSIGFEHYCDLTLYDWRPGR